jgi:DNA-binding GntR family transcriptional regulator
VGAKHRVIRDIVEGLYEGRFRPGQRIIEMELTRRIGVSRASVREALNRLAANGIVELTLQRGATVRQVSPREAVNVLLVAQNLIGLAARLAAQEVEAGANAHELAVALEEVERYDPSTMTAAYARSRNSFYAALITVSGNQELRRLLPSLAVDLIRIQFRPMLTDTNLRRHANYRQIADAVVAGQAEVAEAAALYHLQHAINTLDRLRSVEMEACSPRQGAATLRKRRHPA